MVFKELVKTTIIRDIDPNYKNKNNAQNGMKHKKHIE